jgi:hypothetical protein
MQVDDLSEGSDDEENSEEDEPGSEDEVTDLLYYL